MTAMPDETGAPSEEHVEERARELVHGGEGADALEDDPDKAQAAAKRLLEESEERVKDPAARDHTDRSVIRRKSEETTQRP